MHVCTCIQYTHAYIPECLCHLKLGKEFVSVSYLSGIFHSFITVSWKQNIAISNLYFVQPEYPLRLDSNMVKQVLINILIMYLYL